MLYNLNMKGLATKMELNDFIDIAGTADVSAPALLKQREKLNADVFKYLNHGNLEMFYGEFSENAKTFKGYLILAEDGSDVEIPTTPTTREGFKASRGSCARMKVSNVMDVLNKQILDCQVAPNKTEERGLARINREEAKKVIGGFKAIYVGDRGCGSLAELFRYIQGDEKFVARLKSTMFKAETNYHYLKESMKVTNFSSSKEELIKQEVYSQVLVFNMLEVMAEDLEPEIEQDRYKHEMKININMAVGYIKRYSILVMLEDDHQKRGLLCEQLQATMLSEPIPIRPDRAFSRDGNPKNKRHINKRRSF